MKQSWLKQLLMAIFMLPSMYTASAYAAEAANQFTPRVLGGYWSPAPDITGVRYYHTATKLADGTVLIVGGYDDGGGVLDTVQLYDPNTTMLPAPDPLSKKRASHTATLLPATCSFDKVSKVLVIGGRDDSNGVIRQPELYNPTKKEWEAVDLMGVGRSSHTATLLPGSCKVLVTGGEDKDDNSLTSVEIYNLAPGTVPNKDVVTVSNTGTLIEGRTLHTATLLNDGKVLVTGGYNSTTAFLKSSEIYNPATGTWSRSAMLVTARNSHTATKFLDGKVLVAGGLNDNNGGSLNSAEMYNPATGMWTAVSSLTTKRTEHTAVLLPNQEVLVIGGMRDINISLNNAEIYNPVTDDWRNAAGVMVDARYGHTSILLDVSNPAYTNTVMGKVYIVGGNNNVANALKTASLYSPTAVTLPTPTTDIELTKANFYARVNTKGADDNTKVSFEYGLTTNYELKQGIKAAPEFIAPGLVDVLPVKTAEVVTGLGCGLTYHNRVKTVDTGTGHVVYGGDNVFKTLPCNKIDLKVLLNDYKVNASGNFINDTVFLTVIDTTAKYLNATNNPSLVLMPVTSVTAGNLVTYIATVTNLGPTPVVPTDIKLRLPSIPNLTVNSVDCPAFLNDSINDGVDVDDGFCPLVANVTTSLMQGTGIVIKPLPRNKKVSFRIKARVAPTAPAMNLNYKAMLTMNTNLFVDINNSNNAVIDPNRVASITLAPDLIITAITINPATPAANTNFNAVVTVKNIGNQATVDTNGGFLDVWANQATAVGCNAVGNNWGYVGALGINATKQLTISVPAGVAGAKTLRAHVDSECTVGEFNETNNQFTKTYTVN